MTFFETISALDAVLEEANSAITVQVRNLRPDEVLPEGVCFGFENRPLLEDWAWVLNTKDGNGGELIVGALLASPCHGMVFLARLTMLPGYGLHLPRLLRGFLTDVQKRGYSAYVCYLGSSSVEAKLARILKRAGATEWPDAATCYSGKLADLGKW